MSTPVLFLDEASCHSDEIDRSRAEQTVRTVLATLKQLRRVNKKIALNTAVPISQYQIAPNWTFQSLLGGTSYKEEWDFIRALSDRSPFSQGLAEGVAQEIDGMELQTKPGRVSSKALAWATLVESATVAFDGHPDWSRSLVDVVYCRLNEDGDLLDSDDQVKNVSNAEHVNEHAEWLRLLWGEGAPTAAQIWKEKADRFPHLRFLSRVEKDLSILDGSGVPFLQAMTALEILERDAAVMRRDKLPWPVFSRKASPESEQRRELCHVQDELTGETELFDWHIRFTGNFPGRIHFRVDAENGELVVAYIGGKLTKPI